MPNAVDWLAGSRQYNAARSPSNSTVESTASLFLDEWAQRQVVLGDEPATLPRDLAAAGYHSVFVSANPALNQPWFRDGFDTSWVREEEDFATFADADAADRFLEAWAETPAPRFGWLQLVVGHDYRSGGLPGAPGNWATTDDGLAAAWTSWGQDASETDALLPGIFASNPDGFTAVTADHGELFGQLGSWVVPGMSRHGHGLSSSSGETHVPLALAGPGIEAAIVHEAASTLDLHPTLLRLAGVGTDGGDLLSGEGLRQAASSICFVGDTGNPLLWLASRVRDDGTQVLHTSNNLGLPEWLVWNDSGVPGLSADWVQVDPDTLAAGERELLEGDAAPVCWDDTSICDDEDLAALGYTQCP